MARLDRSYTFKGLDPTPTRESYCIFGDCSHLDHLPVWRQVWLEADGVRVSPYVMNASFLKEQEVQANVCRIWAKHTQLPFFGKLQRCVKYYREFCMARAKAKRQEETELRH